MADMTTDWSKCPQVEKVSDRMSGVLVFKGTRLPVANLLGLLRDGGSIADFIEWYGDSVSEENIKAVLTFLEEDLTHEWAELEESEERKKAAAKSPVGNP